MTISADVLTRLPPRPYDEIRREIRDADILLCSARDAFSRLIRWATKSPWSHVAIAFRLAGIDRVMVLECVEHLGVRAVPLSDFIARTSSGVHPYPGRILLARHQAVERIAGSDTMRTLSGFAFDRLGGKFSRAETVKIATRICLGRLGVRLPRVFRADDEMICSEYVAGCFARIGLPIPWDGYGFVAPSDIADDPQVVAVAQVQTR